MQVKILGSGCAKCNALERKVSAIIEEHHLEDIRLEKVVDFDEILKYDILMTPGLVIDERVKSAGGLPSDNQLLAWLKGE